MDTLSVPTTTSPVQFTLSLSHERPTATLLVLYLLQLAMPCDQNEWLIIVNVELVSLYLSSTCSNWTSFVLAYSNCFATRLLLSFPPPGRHSVAFLSHTIMIIWDHNYLFEFLADNSDLNVILDLTNTDPTPFMYRSLIGFRIGYRRSAIYYQKNCKRDLVLSSITAGRRN